MTFLFKIILFSITIFASKYSLAQEVDNSKYEHVDVKKYLYYSQEDIDSPHYRKTFDEYILDLEYLKKHNKLPKNIKLDEDLAKMNYNGPVILK